MDTSRRQDFLPFQNTLATKDRDTFEQQYSVQVTRWKNAYWLSHRVLGSKARVYYGDVYALPTILGQFDVSIVGSILEHLADPIKALHSISRLTSRSLVITTPMLDTDDKTAYFMGDCELPQDDFVFWTYSRGVYYHVLSMLGFRIDRITEQCFKADWDNGNLHQRHIITATRVPELPSPRNNPVITPKAIFNPRINALERQCSELRASLAAIHRSKSWRITAPARAASRIIRSVTRWLKNNSK
jgi:hypothetical protein